MKQKLLYIKYLILFFIMALVPLGAVSKTTTLNFTGVTLLDAKASIKASMVAEEVIKKTDAIANATEVQLANYKANKTVLLATSTTPDSNNILYVNKAVSGGTADGSSWSNALPELADALVWAKNNEATSWATTPLQIWVAGGTYNPLYSPEDGANFGTNQTRDNTFLMVNNVQLYGGFAGTETTLTARDLSITTNTSILSGDIGTLTDISDNTYHVVVSSGDVGSALLNGFKVTAGNANSYSSILINTNNYNGYIGGGIYNYNSSPSFTNVAITENTASIGGGIYNNNNNNNSSPSFTNVAITENTASSGGGIYNNTSSPSLTNVAITGNTADYYGGGIFNDNNSSPSLTNVAITGNTADYYGGGIYNYDNSSPSLTNTTVVGAIYN
ncbi:hypothetical protein, partial [Winogradskyella wichelsiae]|uniref:hypothetical protein n=1 Tax=Winogradskyella wichelsiae TaxID=2697007 RepID=UPI003EF1C45B